MSSQVVIVVVSLNVTYEKLLYRLMHSTLYRGWTATSTCATHRMLAFTTGQLVRSCYWEIPFHFYAMLLRRGISSAGEYHMKKNL